MERLCGKHAVTLDAAKLATLVAGYDDIIIDIGTGDGRAVRRLALADPSCFVIGIDTCRENLCATARAAPANALFLIADALNLPPELDGLATAVTINFPWGSLLRGLLDADAALLSGLRAITRPSADLTIRLNAGALTEHGWWLASGAERTRRTLCAAGFRCQPPVPLDAAALRAGSTSWARRLAVGRDPRALELRATRCARPRIST